MIDPASGLPVGYTQTNYFLGGSQETFPLQIPSGVTVKKSGSVPVFIWDSVGGAIPPDLMETTSSTVMQPTKIIGLSFLGGRNAIYSEAMGSGNRIDLLVNDCRFSRNQVGVFTKALTGGLARAAVRNCLISDQAPNAMGGRPALQDQQVGIKYWALDSGASSSSQAVGEILNLNTSGSFSAMDPQYPNNGYNGYMMLNLQTSRLVEVWAAESDVSVREHPGAPISYAKSPIPTVKLDIIGGDWVGGDGIDSGWDLLWGFLER